MEKKEAEKKAKEVGDSNPTKGTTKKGVGIKAEAFKVRSKGDLNVPTRIAKECGFELGMKYKCTKTENPKEVLVTVV